MDKKELQVPYHSFFEKHEAGQYFMEQLAGLIVENHEKAENNPELSRDFVQRAKGARDVLDHIRSVIGGTSKK